MRLLGGALVALAKNGAPIARGRSSDSSLAHVWLVAVLVCPHNNSLPRLFRARPATRQPGLPLNCTGHPFVRPFDREPAIMRFGRTLQRSVYQPWRGQYIDYDKLKQLLRDDGSDQGSDEDVDDQWTEEDEGRFVEELVNVQLEKVNNFQSEKNQDLRDRTSECERKLEPLTLPVPQDPVEGGDSSSASSSKSRKPDVSDEERARVLREVLKELDTITKEVSELERYSRINYTGFLKAAKKHDRKRGHSYRVRPLLQVRLAALPFNKEDYSPLLIRLSAMYSFVRQNLEGKEKRDISFSEGTTGGEHFTSHKCMSFRIMCIYRLLTCCSLGSPRELARGQDGHPASPARARLQPSDLQGRRGHPA